MTLEESVFSALSAGAPPLMIYPDLMPEPPILPASVYTVIYLEDIEDIAGNDCRLMNAHVQVDTYALSKKQAASISRQIRTLMLSSPEFTARSLPTVIGLFETDTKLQRYMREFSVWMNP